MDATQQLIQALSTTEADKRSGRLRVGARVDGRLRFATFYLRAGKLLECEFLQSSAAAACEALVDADIVSSVFIQGVIPEFSASSVPPPEQLIEKLRESQEESQANGFDSDALIRVSADTLAEFYGRRAASMIAAIATRHSPEHQAEEFVRACSEQAAKLAGTRKARSAFEPLFALL